MRARRDKCRVLFTAIPIALLRSFVIVVTGPARALVYVAGTSPRMWCDTSASGRCGVSLRLVNRRRAWRQAGVSSPRCANGHISTN